MVKEKSGPEVGMDVERDRKSNISYHIDVFTEERGML